MAIRVRSICHYYGRLEFRKSASQTHPFQAFEYIAVVTAYIVEVVGKIIKIIVFAVEVEHYSADKRKRFLKGFLIVHPQTGIFTGRVC